LYYTGAGGYYGTAGSGGSGIGGNGGYNSNGGDATLYRGSGGGGGTRTQYGNTFVGGQGSGGQIQIYAPKQATATTGSPTETDEGGGVYSYRWIQSGSITF
jgi:hypothetical protein